MFFPRTTAFVSKGVSEHVGQVSECARWSKAPKCASVSREQRCQASKYVKFSSEQVCQVSQLCSTATGEHVRKCVAGSKVNKWGCEQVIEVWKCEGMLWTAVLCVGLWSGLVWSPAVVSGLVGVVVCGAPLRACWELAVWRLTVEAVLSFEVLCGLGLVWRPRSGRVVGWLARGDCVGSVLWWLVLWRAAVWRPVWWG